MPLITVTFAEQLQTAKGDLTARQAAAAVSPRLSVRTVEKWLAGDNEPPEWSHEWLLSCLTHGGNLLSQHMSRAGKAGAAKASQRLRERWQKSPEKQRAIQASAAAKGVAARAGHYTVYRPDDEPPIRGVVNLFAWVRDNRELLGYDCTPKGCRSALQSQSGWRGWRAIKEGQNAPDEIPTGRGGHG